MPLTIEKTEDAAGVLLAVTGEVDLNTSPQLRKALLALTRDHKGAALGVQLSGVGYMDSSGVATLVEGLKAAQAGQSAFCLVAPSNPVMKVLQLARLDMVFTVSETWPPA